MSHKVRHCGTMDLKIKLLVVEEDRPEYIARHGVTIKEVLEVVDKDYAFCKGKLGRWLIIGKTSRGRLLTIVVGNRKETGAYGLVTARVSKKKERSFYFEFTHQIGVEIENDQN